MKTLLTSMFLLGSLVLARATTTINDPNKYAYGANFGWMDWRADVTNGAVIGEYFCSGYIYAANVGWIHLGSGAPVNGIQYQNNSAADFGLNHDGAGNLRGFAYGANIGWINFETNGAPQVDIKTGRLTGFAYAANCGWISLSNAFAYVQTDTVPTADTDGDGIADAYEWNWFGDLTIADGASDFDGDGVLDKLEYLADTDPTDANDYLRITAFMTTSGGTMADLTWASRPTRCYLIQQRLDLNVGNPWFDSGLGLIFPDGDFTMRTVTGTNAPMRFYRVEAVRPLAP